MLFAAWHHYRTSVSALFVSSINTWVHKLVTRLRGTEKHMKTKLLQYKDRWWNNQWRKWIVSHLLWLIKGNLVNKTYSYAFLKWILWFCRNWSVENLRKLGLFVTPSSNGDEHEEVPNKYTGKECWYPFTPIPDVRQFEVELNAFDPIFAMFGIRKRFSPTIKFKKYENEKFNRYMEHQLNRLEDARLGKRTHEGNYSSEEEFMEKTYECIEREWIPISKKYGYFMTIKIRRTLPNEKLYFKIVTSLLKHSRVFFLRQVMLTEPRWHREVPYHKIMRWWAAHRKIAKLAAKYYDILGVENVPRLMHMEDFDSKKWLSYKKHMDFPRMKFHRTFIPKANGKWRPLGIPNHAWRIYLAQWNKFLLKWTKGKINQHQHAYQPDKGVITVWQDIMENIINKRNIYSGDLTKYFDMVTLDNAAETLHKVFSVPSSICEVLAEMHKSLPTNVVVGESCYLNGPFYLKPPKVKDTSLPEWNLKTITRRFVGIPQGGSLSPLLAIILQESKYFPQLEAQGASYVQYSDDVILANNNDEWTPDMTVLDQGIIESKEKSFWVKKDGEWLKPLDFCGLRYDGVLDRIIANTRSGSRLELKDVDGLVPLLTFREIISEDEADPKSAEPLPSKSWAIAEKRGLSTKNILRNQVWGLLQSRLYSGSWELENYEQDFRLTAVKGSLISMHYKQLLQQGVNVFTSTSWAFPVAAEDLAASRRESRRRWRMRSIKGKSSAE